MKQAIGAKAIERFFQFLFLWIFWNMILLNLIWLAFKMEHFALLPIFGVIVHWSAIVLGILMMLPLITAPVLLKEKHRDTCRKKSSQELYDERPIHCSDYLLKLAFVIGDKLHLGYSGDYEENAHNSSSTAEYEISFSHIFAPFMTMSKRIIRRVGKGCNTKRAEPFAYFFSSSSSRSVKILVWYISWSLMRRRSSFRSGSATSLAERSYSCLLYTSPSPRDGLLSRMPSSA